MGAKSSGTTFCMELVMGKLKIVEKTSNIASENLFEIASKGYLTSDV
jgi:hypothetical protein